jgi:hypothetical protein
MPRLALHEREAMRFRSRRRRRRHRTNHFRKEHPMMDVIMLAAGLVFFALSVGYAYACDRL